MNDAPLPGGTRSATDSGTDWTRVAERGTVVVIRFGAWFHRRFGDRPMQGLLWVSSAYFFVFHAAARRASREYLERLSATPEGRAVLGGRPGSMRVLRHIHSFAISLYDRMLVFGGALESYEIEHDGSEKIFDLAREGRGALLLGAHLGSFELLWFLSREYDLAVNVVVYYQNAERINSFFETLSPGAHVRAIGIDPGSVRAAFQIKACIDRGEFVVMLADRVAPGGAERVAAATFLGATAQFPLGPFLIAGILDCPVLFALCVRKGVRRYQTVLKPLRDGERVARSERDKRARELMAQYIRLLESYCHRYPFEWFNYFSYWSDDRADGRDGTSG